jgi:hypothetical protein
MLMASLSPVTKSDGKTEVKAILSLVAHVGTGLALMQRSCVQVQDQMSTYFL